MKTKIKNKKINVAVLYVLFVLSLVSCSDFLDQVPDDRLAIDDVFKKRTTTEQYLANIYNYIRSEVDHNTSNTPWEGLSDEMDVTYNDYPTYSMNLGSWDINRGDYNYWNYYYRGIRSASYFLQNVDANEELTPELLTQYKAEARFLRAYFYFMVMRQYGPVVILPEEPIEPDASIEEMSIPRSTYDECADYVASEIDQAFPDLPIQPDNTIEWGRINQGMALAIKARMLLYAASPLFNGNTDYAGFTNPDGTPLISQQYDENKWKEAADASKVVIDLPQYQLYREYNDDGGINAYASLKNVFLRDWNPEIIMAKVSDMYSVDKNGSPYRVGGWSSWGPTQSAVDAYFMANGRPIDDSESGYLEEGFADEGTSYYAAGTYNMYVNREPRFYVAITFNGSKWINNEFGSGGQPLVIEMYNGGNSGRYTGRNWSRTGYVTRKLVHPSSTVNPDKIAGRMEVKLRLAEIYLSYAEALNEYSPGHPDILKYINLIRERAGIPQYGSGNNALPVPQGQEAMRKAIRQERRVELAFENQRYFDTRRWKIAENTDGGPFYGMDVNANNTEGFSKRVEFETRVFEKKNYLWNIIQDELNKNGNLVGNPGW
ncbi:RagB/SusD family nutrient uptake outer membrane protein [Sinomicrobium sp. M5D2P17]